MAHLIELMQAKHLLTTFLFGALLLVSTDPCVAQGDLRSEEVRSSIKRAIDYLKSQQSTKGTWTPHPNFTGGVTALCTLALLESGVPAGDPTIQNALRALRRMQSSAAKRTYTVALMTMVYCRAGNPADLPLIRKNVKWLQTHQNKGGSRKGSWGYDRGQGDPSNTQFAILALYEAALVGMDVSATTWKAALGYWETSQQASGGWSYSGPSARGSMTCAGIASVVMATRQLKQSGAKFINGQCECGTPPNQTVVDRGLEWLGRNFSVRHNPIAGTKFRALSREKDLYYLYAMERVGRITGQRFFYGPPNKADGRRPQYDWYREGAAFLLATQQRNGSWVGGGIGETNPHTATSMALLFLAKGRRPVLISKLQRPGNDWNRAAENLTHLTQYVERKWKLPLTYQVINLEKAAANDYAQTPVLFLSGTDAFTFTATQRAQLRRYIEQGGFLFIDGCCGDNGFDASIRSEMQKMFPDAEHNLHQLEATHPIWSIDEKVDLQSLDPDGRWLWGINFACKTSVVYCPGNLSCFWELMGPDGQTSGDVALQAEIDTCRAIGNNVLAYATNKNLKPKDAIPVDIEQRSREETLQRGHFAIAKIQHAGGCNVAPRAMVNLMEAVTHSLGMHTANETPLISLSDPALFDYQFVAVQGRHDFRLSAKEKRQLKLFVQRGGTILADAICGSPRFAQAFRREMQAIFNRPLEPVKADDPLFTSAYGGADIRKVSRREVSRDGGSDDWEIRTKIGPPQLEGIAIDGRWAVLFSPLDLSCALENHTSPDCAGYTSADAARIGINVILYSLHQ
ncbi:MAG: DUF4159 domain-containing protein [Planctomycetota bacterium]|nr:DUF4159 domain-containing protein [Planctomycetota bacterium]